MMLIYTNDSYNFLLLQGGSITLFGKYNKSVVMQALFVVAQRSIVMTGNPIGYIPPSYSMDSASFIRLITSVDQPWLKSVLN